MTRVNQLVQNPTEKMLVKAQETARYQTFTTPLKKTGRAIQRIFEDHPLLKVVVPFLRTMTDIFKYTVGERTVFALLSKEVRDNLSGKNGPVAQDTQMSRFIMGTAVSITGIYLASRGLITGS